MRIICWQMILMKYHTLFFPKIRKDIAKFVVCCSRDWHWYFLVVMEMLEIKQFHDNSNQMENLILYKYEKFEVR